MRQVPTASATPPGGIDYVILGDGRLSKHLQFYFSEMGISFAVWRRSSGQSIAQSFVDLPVGATFLLAVSDAAIVPLATQVAALLPQARRVHFSGALSTPLAEGWHPLMTFAHTLYPLELYQSLFFVGESGRATFNEVFPALPNPSAQIAAADRPLYHAFCVIAGNFSQLLWSHAAAGFQDRLALPPSALAPYLRASLENFLRAQAESGRSALTGPLVRRDYATIRSHLRALHNDPFLPAYRALVAAYGEEHEDFRLSEIQT